MIDHISISNIGVIEAASLELSPGFNCLTGETGAGKTMVLTALGLLLGGRADSGAVRHGADQLRVSATWSLGDLQVVAEKVAELGGDFQGGELVVNRSLSAEGKSRVSIGGASAPVSALAELGENLVAVHGQSDQLRLKSPAAQREALDRFASAELQETLEAYRQGFKQWRETQRRLERLRNSSSADQARALELREFLNQLEAADPKPDELDELQLRIQRIESVAALSEAAVLAQDLLSSTEREADAIGLVGQVRRTLDSVAAKDGEIAGLALRAGEVSALLTDLASEVSRYVSGLEVSPGELDRLQERRASLNSLCRRWGGDLAELLERSKSAVNELMDLESGDEQLEKLEQLEADQLAQISHLATQLTTIRTSAAEQLGAAVTTELKELALGGAEFVVRVLATEDFDSNGRDSVEFLLAPHPGAAPRPVHKGASGGELSRVMLAIELVLADEHQLPTMVFDEVDSGVGGRAAVELGRRLKKLSKNTQVIVVTHLPQVAAFADTQLKVTKSSDGLVTSSSVVRLKDAERVTELARMLSGDTESDLALGHAEQLLQNARQSETD